MIIERNFPFSTKDFIEFKPEKKQDKDVVFLINKKNDYTGIVKKGGSPYILMRSVRASTSPDNALDMFLANGFSWEILGNMMRIAKTNRIIVAPSDKKKQIQNDFNLSLSNIRIHRNVYGFVVGRSAYDGAKAHTDFHKGSFGLLMKMDINNFFNSFSETSIKDSLAYHGYKEEDVSTLIDSCMMDVSPSSELVKMILCELIKRSVRKEHIDEAKNSDIDLVDQIAELFLYAASLSRPDHKRRNVMQLLSTLQSGRYIGTRKCRNATKIKRCDIISDVIEYILKCGPNTRFGSKMLLQGGPSSPFLSNICFSKADYRINAYIEACGGFYTRYADDLCFSFMERKSQKQINIILYRIENILLSEGFVANQEKTSIRGLGKQQKIVGYLVNSGRPTIPRSYKDEVYRMIKSIGSKEVLSIEHEIQKIKGMIAYIASADTKSAKELEVHLSKVKFKQSTRRIEI